MARRGRCEREGALRASKARAASEAAALREQLHAARREHEPTSDTHASAEEECKRLAGLCRELQAGLAAKQARAAQAAAAEVFRLAEATGASDEARRSAEAEAAERARPAAEVEAREAAAQA